MKSSKVVFAIVAFAILNLALGLFYKPTIEERLANNTLKSCWYAVKACLDNPAADVVLLGSSLVRHVVCDGDATYLNSQIDENLHRRCHHLESTLSARAGTKVTTCSMAVGGQFASDAAALSTVIVDKQNPRIVIYGISPRDFMSNWLVTPRATETFKLVTQLYPSVSSDEYCVDSAECLENRLQSFFERVSPVYGLRAEFYCATRRSLRETASRFLVFDRKFSSEVRKWFADTPILVDALPGERMLDPIECTSPPYRDNSARVTATLNPPNPQMFTAQLHFLDKALENFSRHGVHVIIVNMPLMKENILAMNPDYYESYLRETRKLSEKNGAEYLDMNKSTEFSKKDFADTAHLNGNGAGRFVEVLTEKLSPKSVACLRGAKPGSIADSRSLNRM